MHKIDFNYILQIQDLSLALSCAQIVHWKIPSTIIIIMISISMDPIKQLNAHFSI